MQRIRTWNIDVQSTNDNLSDDSIGVDSLHVRLVTRLLLDALLSVRLPWMAWRSCEKAWYANCRPGQSRIHGKNCCNLFRYRWAFAASVTAWWWCAGGTLEMHRNATFSPIIDQESIKVTKSINQKSIARFLAANLDLGIPRPSSSLWVASVGLKAWFWAFCTSQSYPFWVPFNTLSELFYTEHILSYIKYGSIDTFSSYMIIDPCRSVMNKLSKWALLVDHSEGNY